jgi:hypothetical protein
MIKLPARKRSNQLRRIHTVLQQLNVQKPFFATRTVNVLKPVVIPVFGWHQTHLNFDAVGTKFVIF